MRVAIMQPYFLPYIGYFQLIAAVDKFVVYDNIKYTKKGWINRNRILQNGKDVVFTLPLKAGSDALNIVDRELSADFSRGKLLNQITGAYRRAPYFRQTIGMVEEVVMYGNANLFEFLKHSIVLTCRHLNLGTEIQCSSTIPIDHGLKSQEKVLAICEAVGATTYINTIGGTGLYSREVFQSRNMQLKFIEAQPLNYAQFEHDFVPWLSIVDVMMFNSQQAVIGKVTGNYRFA